MMAADFTRDGSRRLVAIACAVVFLASHASATDGVLHVDDGAAGGGDGASWATALDEVRDALAIAAVPENGIREIRVAGGLYLTDVFGGDQAATFTLVNGVQLLGGFAGPGGKDPDEQAPHLYILVVSGDLFFNDLPDAPVGHPSLQDNAYHVVTATTADDTAVIDGFLIMSGNANAGGFPGSYGGGVLVQGGSPTISNCTLRANYSNSGGGAILYHQAPPQTVHACRFEDNAGPTAGAVEILEGAELIFTSCTFDGNRAVQGGGGAVHADTDTVRFEGCDFANNHAENESGGGAWCTNGTMLLVGCTFDGNDAPTGGAASFDCDGGLISGCDFTGNSAGNGGAVAVEGNQNVGIDIEDSSFEMNDCIVNGGALFIEDGGAVLVDSTFDLNAAGNRGGAIFADREIDATNVSFSQSSADDQGGAIYWSAGGTLSDCDFDQNTSDFGGAILFTGEAQTVVNTTFTRNSATVNGGAVRGQTNTAASLVGCLFAGNFAPTGGGAYFNQATPELRACTFTANVATVSLGGGIMFDDDVTAVVSGSVLWGNAAIAGGVESSQVEVFVLSEADISYCCIQGLDEYAGRGNIGLDPQFVAGAGGDGVWGTDDDDAGLSPGSPCIDAAHNWLIPLDEDDVDGDGLTDELMPFDLDGAARVADGTAAASTGCGVPAIVDMGALEHQGIPADDVIFPDITGDGSVNVADLLVMLTGWGACSGCCLSDLDLDGATNVQDLLTVLTKWSSN